MKLITFDWDQTLWNSWDIHVMAAQHAASSLRQPLPTEEWIASTFSVPFGKHMELLFPTRTQEATDHYLEYYHSRVEKLGYLYEGVPETLETLKRDGYLLGLLSDKRQVYGEAELKSTRIGDLFDCVMFLDGRRDYKPDPAGLVRVMDSLAVSGGEVLYVGDSYVDVQCARRAGVASAAALWGSVNPEAVLKESPDHILHSIPELLTALNTG